MEGAALSDDTTQDRDRPVALETRSTLTSRYQTTVPEAVRRALGLGKRDRLRYLIRSDGGVELRRAEADEDEDPVLAQFLGFLAADLERRPEALRPVDAALAARVHELVGDLQVDLDAALPDDGDD